MTTNALIGAFALLAAMSSGQDAAVPVEEEPDHRTVFKNDYVQAFRVTLEPGRATRMHTHARDDAAVRLSTATVAVDTPGQPLGPPESRPIGSVSARDNEANPLTHRVHNIGTTVFDVVDVQILSRPAGPAAPAISTPAAENATMRVYRYELGPGVSTARHAHSRPYLLVAATDVGLRVTSGEVATQHADRAGDMRWIESAGTHVLTNAGAGTAILVEFELK